LISAWAFEKVWRCHFKLFQKPMLFRTNAAVCGYRLSKQKRAVANIIVEKLGYAQPLS
jgi:hypothetical protein